MEFDGEFDVAATPSETWDFLLDPEELSSCIPNCKEVEVIDETHYTATIEVSISYISASFDTNVEITEQRREEYIQVHLAGDAEEGDSRIEATGEVELEPRDDGGTHLDYVNRVDVTGRIMNMGSRVVKRVGRRLTDQTIDNLQGALGEPS